MKKTLFLLMLLVTGLVFTGCANVRKDQNFKVLSIDDIKDMDIKISFRARSGIIRTALNKLVKEFENEYPYITVEEADVTGDYNAIRETTILDINSGNKESVPDLLIGYPDHFAEYFGGSNLVNLQRFIDDSKVGYSEEEMADFLPSYLTENRGFNTEYPDDLYGLPFNKSTEVMVYNKTAFEALFGPTYLTKVPKTWEEAKAVGKEIISKIKAGELDNTFVETEDPKTGAKTYLKVSNYLADPKNVKFIPFDYDSADNGFITLTRQFGGKYTVRESVYEGYVAFDNAESRTAMTYFQNLKNEGLFGVAASFGASYNSDAFKLIQILMTVGSSAGVGYNIVNSKYKYELGVAPVPYYEEDAKFVIQQGTNVGMLNHNNDEEKLAAWLFIKFLLRSENTAAFAMDTGGYLPVRKSAYETAEYKEYLSNPTDDKIYHSAAAKVALNDYIAEGYKFFVDDAFIGSSEVRTEAGRIFDSVIVNNATIVDRYKEAYNTLSPYVKGN